MGSQNDLSTAERADRNSSGLTEAEQFKLAKAELEAERAKIAESVPEGPLLVLALGLTDACITLSSVLHEAVEQNGGKFIGPGLDMVDQVIATSFGTAALAVSDGVQAIAEREEVAALSEALDGIMGGLVEAFGELNAELADEDIDPEETV